MNAFLIWSNQHGMWWRPARRGYTTHIEEAGRYTRTEADAIVHDATVGGQLSTQRTDPVTGLDYRQFTEVVVPAPEHPELVRARTGNGNRGLPLWRHECGNVDAFPADWTPDDGGCDACESGSDNPADWQPLYLNTAAGTPSAPLRVGLAVDSSNGAHVRFRVFAATGGAHLGGCGHLVMRTDEYAAFRALLEPALTDRPDPTASASLAEEDCSYRDDPGHDHEQCLDQHAADIAAGLTLNAKDCLRRTAGDFIPKRGPAPAFATVETIRSLRDLGLIVYTGDDYHLTDAGRLVVDELRRAESVPGEQALSILADIARQPAVVATPAEQERTDGRG